MTDYDDRCPGYVTGRTGEQGVCCCGLHWYRVMPEHTADGKVISEKLLDRFHRRAVRRLETQLRLAREVSHGSPMPYGRGHPKVK